MNVGTLACHSWYSVQGQYWVWVFLPLPSYSFRLWIDDMHALEVEAA